MIMNKRKSFSFFIHKYFFYYIIIQILFLIVLSEKCDKCEVNDNKVCSLKSGYSEGDCAGCKPHLNTQDCYKCSGNDDSKYYLIGDDGSCAKKDSCQNKVVEETNECVGQCFEGTYQLGDDYCTFTCENDPKREVYNSQLKICKCKNIFKIDLVGGKKKYQCLLQSRKCLGMFICYSA